MDVTYRCGWCRDDGVPDGAAPAVLVARGTRGPIGFRFVRRPSRRNGEELQMEPLGVLRGSWTVRLWCEGCGHSITPMKANRLRRMYHQALRTDAHEVYVA
jgi:hypothetical protein